MRSIKMIGLGIVAVLAVAVTASAASAHEFKYTGKVGDPLLASATTSQLFVAGFGTVHCGLASIDNGKVQSLSGSEQLADVLYSMCAATVPLLGTKSVKEPILALYNFLASEEVDVEAEISFEIIGVCTIKVPKQKLGGVKYKNVGTMLEVESNVSGITWSDNEPFSCGGSGGSAGTYKGNALVEGDGGTLSWS